MTNATHESSFFDIMFDDSASKKRTKSETQIKGSFVGTRDYIAPEMIDNNISGPFSDLWAFGMIMYKLYSGKLPWSGKSQL